MKTILNFILIYLLLFVPMASAKKFEADDILFGLPSSSGDLVLEHRDGGFLKKVFNGDWFFSNDGAVEKKIGSGAGSAELINNLNNPDFEDGITSDWTCTATKCTEETSAPLNGTKSLIFTPTAQNNEFESTLKAIGSGLMGRSCEARVFYLGGDENLTAQVVNGDSEVKGEAVLKVHDAAGFESVWFLCPTQDEITADSDKGDLQLRVYNETATPAAAATFDDMYLGNLIGLVETVLPDTAAAVITNNGTAAILTQSANEIVSVNRSGVGVVDITLLAGEYTVNPSVVVSVIGAGAYAANSVTVSTTAIQIQTSASSSGAGSDQDFSIKISKQGVDAKQSVQIYKNIPTIGDSTNEMGVRIENNGTASIISQHPANPILSVSRTGLGNVLVTFKVGFFTVAPAITGTMEAGSDTTGASVQKVGLTSASVTIITKNDGVVAIDNDFSLTISRQGDDVKQQTVQPILVNQVSTSYASGIRAENCRVNNNGTATIDTDSGLCESWIDTTTRDSVGQVTVDFISAIFSLEPVCTLVTFGSTSDIFDVEITVISNTSITYRTKTSTGGTLGDRDIFMSCKGAR